MPPAVTSSALSSIRDSIREREETLPTRPTYRELTTETHTFTLMILWGVHGWNRHSFMCFRIQKRKHNRVKTWTRHVDLFQKDFIFVPINESWVFHCIEDTRYIWYFSFLKLRQTPEVCFSLSSAHWYLAVVCFPGLDGVHNEPNLLYKPPTAAQSSAVSSVLPAEEEEPEIGHHAAAVTGQPDASDEAGQQYTGEHRWHESVTSAVQASRVQD